MAVDLQERVWRRLQRIPDVLDIGCASEPSQEHQLAQLASDLVLKTVDPSAVRERGEECADTLRVQSLRISAVSGILGKVSLDHS